MQKFKNIGYISGYLKEGFGEIHNEEIHYFLSYSVMKP